MGCERRFCFRDRRKGIWNGEAFCLRERSVEVAKFVGGNDEIIKRLDGLEEFVNIAVVKLMEIVVGGNFDGGTAIMIGNKTRIGGAIGNDKIC